MLRRSPRIVRRCLQQGRRSRRRANLQPSVPLQLGQQRRDAPRHQLRLGYGDQGRRESKRDHELYGNCQVFLDPRRQCHAFHQLGPAEDTHLDDDTEWNAVQLHTGEGQWDPVAWFLLPLCAVEHWYAFLGEDDTSDIVRLRMQRRST